MPHTTSRSIEIHAPGPGVQREKRMIVLKYFTGVRPGAGRSIGPRGQRCNSHSAGRRDLRFAGALCLAALVSLAGAAQSSDETRLRLLTDRFFAAYAREDLDHLLPMWSSKSPDSTTIGKALEETFAANEKIEVKNLNVRKVEVADEKATLRVAFEFSAIEVKTAKPPALSEKQNRTFEFVKEGGDWKIFRYVSSEAVLAAALVAAKSESDRESLLASENELVTVELVRALLSEGDRFRILGDYSQALDACGLAKRVAERLQDLVATTDALRGVGNVHFSRGSYTEALQLYHESLRLSYEIFNKDRIARSLNNIGATHHSQGNYTQALETLQRSLRISEETADKQLIAATLINIGNVHLSQGNHLQAIGCYEKSLRILEEKGDRGRIAEMLINIGNVHALQGNYIQALRHYQSSLKIREELGEKKEVAATLANIGIVHTSQGNHTQALDHYRKSLKIREEIGDKEGTAQTLNNIGIVHRMQGQYTRALEAYQKSLEIKQERGDKKGIASTLNNIGFLLYSQGNHAEALERYQESLTISVEGPDKALMAAALNGIGHIRRLQQNYAEALGYYNRSLNISQELGSKEAIAETLTNIGIVHYSRGNRAQARQHFANAITAVEELRVRVAGDEQQQQQFFANKLSPYHQMIELLIDEKNPAEALSYVERIKGRALLDTLETGRVDITKAITESERAEEQSLKAEVVALNNLIRRKEPAKAALIDLEARREKARAAYEAFQINLFAAHPELEAQRGKMQPIGIEEAGSLIKAGAAVLEFVVTEYKTFLFTLTQPPPRSAAGQPRVLKAHTLNIQEKELGERVKRFRRAIVDRDLNIGDEAKVLYDLLLGPARGELADKTTLIIVPDGPLWELPFQALKSEPKRFLVEDCAISYAPSLTTLFHMTKIGARHRGRPETLFAIGNPAVGQETAETVQSLCMDERLGPLPEAERLAKTVGQMYGSRRSKVYVGAEAREDRVKTEAPEYGIIHIAAHGVLNDKSPMYSHLVLSRAEGNRGEDGLLEAWEIMKLDLKADLVILSACETARGRIGNGEGVIGLAWASFIAGAATTVVSQWKVESSSTTELMIEFHRQLRLRKSKAEALRLASLKLLRTERYRHPFYWAGFVIIGDAR